LGLAGRLPARAAEGGGTTSAPPATVEQEVDNLVQLDDLSHEEIEQWMAEAVTNRFANDIAQKAALNLKIKQRRDVVDAAYAQFLVRHPDHVRALILYGSFLREGGQDAEALQQWQQASRLAPTNAAVWNNLGNYYGEEGPVTNAFACYAKAIEIAPREPLYHQNLARNIFLNHAEAIQYYRLKPQAVVAKAQLHFRKVCELWPTNFAAATEYAQSFYAAQVPLTGSRPADWAAAQKLSDEALAAWKSALKLAGTEVERQGVCLHMARIQINAERWSEARKSLAEVREPTLAGLKAELEVKLEARKDGPSGLPKSPAK
jgi:tetratricopeptide (TPR) repeat protein